MTQALAARASAQTLPGWLRTQSERRGAAPALRHKRRGLWHTQSWRELENSVRRLSSQLVRRGFQAGDRLFIDTAPTPASLSLALAAQWLGGTVVVGPESVAGTAATNVADGAPVNGSAPAASERVAAGARFALVADEGARAGLEASRAERGQLRLAIVLDGERGPEGVDSAWVTYEELAATDCPLAPSASVEQPTALALLRGRAPATHRELVTNARRLIGRAGIDAVDSALAGNTLTLADQLEHVAPAWLLAGFCWSFGEQPSTEDVDRRELGPSLLFGASRAYAELTERVAASLPGPGQLTGRWIDAGLTGRGTGGRLARRFLTGRLREVLGFARVKHALAIGDASSASAGFERMFGLSLIEWPERPAPAPERDAASDAAPRATAHRSLGFDAGLGTASRSDA
jgi:hypothetical protein